MEYWQIVCIAVSLILIVLNPKVRLLKILGEQFKVYSNDNTKKMSVYDIITFLVLPVILAVSIAFSLPYNDLMQASETIITVFSLVATLLLSFLALLIDKSTSNTKEKEVVKQTFVTITVDIIYSIFVVGLFAISYFINFNATLEYVFVALVVFLIIKILLNVFMILKRVFAVLSKENNDDEENNQ